MHQWEGWVFPNPKDGKVLAWVICGRCSYCVHYVNHQPGFTPPIPPDNPPDCNERLVKWVMEQ